MNSGSFDPKFWQEWRRALAVQATNVTPHQRSLIEQVVGAGEKFE